MPQIQLKSGEKTQSLDIDSPFFIKSATIKPVIVHKGNIFEVKSSLETDEEADGFVTMGGESLPIVQKESVAEQERRYVKSYKGEFEKMIGKLGTVHEYLAIKESLDGQRLVKDIKRDILPYCNEGKVTNETADKFRKFKESKSLMVCSPLVGILLGGIHVGNDAIAEAFAKGRRKPQQPKINEETKQLVRTWKQREKMRDYNGMPVVDTAEMNDLLSDKSSKDGLPSLEKVLALDSIQFPILTKLTNEKSFFVGGGLPPEKVWLLEKGEGPVKFIIGRDALVPVPYAHFNVVAQKYLDSFSSILETRIKRIEKFITKNESLREYASLAKYMNDKERKPKSPGDIGFDIQGDRILIYKYIQFTIVPMREAGNHQNLDAYMPLPQTPDAGWNCSVVKNPPQDIKFGFWIYYDGNKRRNSWPTIINYEPSQYKFPGHYKFNATVELGATGRGLCAPGLLDRSFYADMHPVELLNDAMITLITGWARAGIDHYYDTPPKFFTKINLEEALKLEKSGKYYRQTEKAEESAYR